MTKARQRRKRPHNEARKSDVGFSALLTESIPGNKVSQAVFGDSYSALSQLVQHNTLINFNLDVLLRGFTRGRANDHMTRIRRLACNADASLV